MKISYEWLQEYIDATLPEPKVLAEGIALHALEVEDVEQKGDDYILDVKVTPDRAHDCLSHIGIAREVSAVFSLPLKKKEVKDIPVTSEKKIHVEVEDSKLCPRFTAVVIEHVKVGPSPEWLSKRLEALGQRSINNVVDATNYILYGLGKPLHAYDFDKVQGDTLFVRGAKTGEKVVTLDGKEIALDGETLVIADAKGALGIAGVKGGRQSEVDANTTTIILESANFNSSLIRSVSQKVNIKTDAVKCFENGQTSELCLRGLEEAVALIVEIAGTSETKVGAATDVYTKKEKQYKVGVSVSEVNKLLGTKLSTVEIENIFKRRGFGYTTVNPRKKIESLAETCVGKPYKLGASVLYDAPESFDCSSLASYLYVQAGFAIPRISVDQFVYAEQIAKGNLVLGDLIFSNTGTGKIYMESVEYAPGTKVPSGIDHVGIYMGEGKILHATRYKNEVVIENLDESEQFKNIVGYGKVLFTDEERFVIDVPFERLDIRIKEDVIDDIARLVGTEAVTETTHYEGVHVGHEHKRLYYMTRARNFLVERGFSEVMTYSLVPEGEREVLSSVNPEKNKVRKTLAGGMMEALEKNIYYAPLLGLSDVYTFEFGNVFSKNNEKMYLGLAVKVQSKQKIKNLASDMERLITNLFTELGAIREHNSFTMGSDTQSTNLSEYDFDKIINNLPEPKDLQFLKVALPKNLRYTSLSAYPFTTRDVAVFVPQEIETARLEQILKENAGPLLVRLTQFDKFQKEGDSRISYAYRLVFQSFEKTLSDEDINPIMEKVTTSLNSQENWQVR